MIQQTSTTVASVGDGRAVLAFLHFSPSALTSTDRVPLTTGPQGAINAEGADDRPCGIGVFGPWTVREHELRDLKQLVVGIVAIVVRSTADQAICPIETPRLCVITYRRESGSAYPQRFARYRSSTPRSVRNASTISSVTSSSKQSGSSPPGLLQALRPPHREPLRAELYGQGQLPS